MTSVIRTNRLGTKEWMVNNIRHREDGPAWLSEDRLVSKDAIDWIKEHNISWPFSQEDAMLFELTWG